MNISPRWWRRSLPAEPASSDWPDRTPETPGLSKGDGNTAERVHPKKSRKFSRTGLNRFWSPSDSLGQPEDHSQRSLFGEILDWMLVPLLLLWPVSVFITYLVAKSIANEPFDLALTDKVMVIAQQVREDNGRIAAQLPQAAQELIRADDIIQVTFQVVGPNGEHLEGDPDMPPPPDKHTPSPWAVKIRNDMMRNAEVRIAHTYLKLHRSAGGQRPAGEPYLVLIQVGETLEKRTQLANQIIKGVILPQFIILPIALGLVWLALSRGLSPLAQLQQGIRARRPDDLSPINPGQVPEEISPLVGSLNEMLERLSQTIQNQKRFIADAAHQMKTPLAGMRMQSELALRQTSREEIHRSLEQLAKSSESATRLVNQLLALARAENPVQNRMSFIPLELSALAREVVQEWVPASLTRKIDLGFEQPDHAAMIMGNPTMLRELLNNLIDNALRYTPSAGSVTVRVRADSQEKLAFLEVEDTGPGIPATERAHIFERFYRILGSQVEGSGLGLAIVREIAQQHDAEVDIFSNPRCPDPQCPGSLFRVTFHMQFSTGHSNSFR